MILSSMGYPGVLATILMLIGAPGGHAILEYCVMDHIFTINQGIDKTLPFCNKQWTVL